MERCQNLPGSNDQAWASGDPAQRGGFVYFLNRWAGLQVEALALHLIPDEGPCPEDTCTIPSFGLSFGFFFGG